MTRFIAAATVALALVLAGCGGPSEREKYTKAVNKAVQETGAQIVSSSQQINAQSQKENDQAAVMSQRASLLDLATKLSKLKAPGDLDAANEELVSEIQAYGESLRRDDPAQLAQDTKLAQSRIKATITQINGGQ